MLTFRFSGTRGEMAVEETLTSGMVGKQMLLEFSPDWEGLSKTVVFSNGSHRVNMVCTGSTVTIPARVLEKPLRTLTVGVYGISSDGKLVIPTIRAEGPTILPGVDPSGDPATDPDLPIWAQMLSAIGPLDNLQTEDRENLVAAVNELAGKMPEPGEDGVTFVPSVSEDGILSWTNDGGLENPGPVSIIGPEGPRGAVGMPGLRGADGKSAYAYAQEGGYTGTEAEFAAKLAREQSNPAALTFTGAVEAVYDGSEAVHVEIPGGFGSGGTEWKKLTETTITEEGVTELVFTQTDDGNSFSANELILFAKAMPRESISSMKVGTLDRMQKVLLQTNSFGNKTTVKYYTMSYLKIANRIRVEMIEGNYDVFKEGSIYPIANGVYDDGVQYYRQSDYTPTDYVKVVATNGFVSGDIVEIWYR